MRQLVCKCTVTKLSRLHTHTYNEKCAPAKFFGSITWLREHLQCYSEYGHKKWIVSNITCRGIYLNEWKLNKTEKKIRIDMIMLASSQAHISIRIYTSSGTGTWIFFGMLYQLKSQTLEVLGVSVNETVLMQLNKIFHSNYQTIAYNIFASGIYNDLCAFASNKRQVSD